MSTKITVFCYVIEHTDLDYRNTITHDSSGAPRQIMTEFTKVHGAFAKNSPEEESLLGFPISVKEGRDSDPVDYYLLCQCTSVGRVGGRSSVRLIGIATELSELTSQKISLTTLLTGVQEYTWEQVALQKKPTVDLSVGNDKYSSSTTIRDAIVNGLNKQQKSITLKDRTRTPQLLFNTLAEACMQCHRDPRTLKLAVFLPGRIKLPIDIDVALVEPHPTTAELGKHGNSKPNLSNIQGEILDQINKMPHPTPRWQDRLWHMWQDVIEVSEEFERAIEQQDRRGQQLYKQMLADRIERFEKQLSRQKEIKDERLRSNILEIEKDLQSLRSRVEDLAPSSLFARIGQFGSNVGAQSMNLAERYLRDWRLISLILTVLLLGGVCVWAWPRISARLFSTGTAINKLTDDQTDSQKDEGAHDTKESSATQGTDTKTDKKTTSPKTDGKNATANQKTTSTKREAKPDSKPKANTDTPNQQPSIEPQGQ